MAFTPNPAVSFFGYDNFYSAILQTNITATDIDIPLDIVPNGTQGYLVIDPLNAATREVILYSSKTASKVTVPSVADGRGVDGSTASAHNSGVLVIMAVVSAHLEGLSDGTLVNDAARLYSQPHYDLSNKFVVSGGVVTDAGGLNVNVSNYIGYVLGRRYTGTFSTSVAVTASATGWIILIHDTTTGLAAVSYSQSGTAMNLATTTVLAEVVTGVGSITSISQRGFLNSTTAVGKPIYPILKGMSYPGWNRFDLSTAFTNVTVGNGTITCRYKRIGNTVHVFMALIFGSTTAVTGAPTITLPIVANPGSYNLPTGAASALGRVTIYDTSAVATFFGAVSIPAGAGLTAPTTAVLTVDNAAGTYIQPTAISSTVPMTFAVGDCITANFTYECDNV